MGLRNLDIGGMVEWWNGIPRKQPRPRFELGRAVDQASHLDNGLCLEGPGSVALQWGSASMTHTMTHTHAAHRRPLFPTLWEGMVVSIPYGA